jgi:hypothetical protein
MDGLVRLEFVVGSMKLTPLMQGHLVGFMSSDPPCSNTLELLQVMLAALC